VGAWALDIGKAALPLARVAPGSTPLWLAASILAGGAAGAHASGVDGSPLSEVDPKALSEHVLAMADAGRDLDSIDGEVAGSLLGAFTYLGGRLAPEEFVRWIEAADPEAILAGANAGEAYASRDEVDGTVLEGALAGGSLGLFGGYAGLELEVSEPNSERRESLEEDIASYLEALAEVDDAHPSD
jgi:hypothetical protein